MTRTFDQLYFNGHSYGAGVGCSEDNAIPDLVNAGYNFSVLYETSIGAPDDTTLYEDTFER